MSISISGTTLEALKTYAHIALREYKGYLLWAMPTRCYDSDGFLAGGVKLNDDVDPTDPFSIINVGSFLDDCDIEGALSIAESFVDSFLLQKAGAPEELYLSVLR